MNHLITGGAGCIGSELAAALLARGDKVRVLDNLSTGRREHLPDGAEFMLGDVRNPWSVLQALKGVEMVWHLAAKTDIKFIGDYDFTADYNQNLMATWGLLRAMHQLGIKRLAFASSAAVYGDSTNKGHRPNACTSGKSICDWCGKSSKANSWVLEGDCPKAPMMVITESMSLEPVSMYGATKLACESLIRAMALRAGIQSWIFRYCSIVSGKARTSGNMVIPDLIHKLQKDPNNLEILGDGNQTKPSLHVSECVEAMLHLVEYCPDQASIHNIGVGDAISVTRQAELICEAMGINPEFHYTGGAGGWPGDVPSFRMNVGKLNRLGWKAKWTSEQAVKMAIKGLLESGE